MTTITLTCHILAGRKLMDALLVSHCLTALLTNKKMALFVMPTAKTVTVELGQCAGKIAHMTKDSMTMVPIATSQMLMAEVPGKCMSVLDVKNGEISGTSNVTMISIMLAAAFAHPIVQKE